MLFDSIMIVGSDGLVEYLGEGIKFVRRDLDACGKLLDFLQHINKARGVFFLIKFIIFGFAIPYLINPNKQESIEEICSAVKRTVRCGTFLMSLIMPASDTIEKAVL